MCLANSHLAGDKAHRQQVEDIENFWNRYQETQSSARILYLHNTVDCSADQSARILYLHNTVDCNADQSARILYLHNIVDCNADQSARILYLHYTVDCNADQVAIWGHTCTVVLNEHSDM